MKRNIRFTLPLACLSLALLVAAAGASPKSGKARDRYLVTSSHTAEECLAELDKFDAAGKAALAKWDFGCGDGDHNGYAIVDAASADEALKSVPEPARSRAKAVKLHKFTAAEIRSFHEQHAGK